MKKTTALREIRESSMEELTGRLSRLEGELFKLKLRLATNQLENTMQVRATRREIARVMTIIAQKQQGIAGAPKTQESVTE
jgi:large subunit ribosomal protein L29